MTYAENLWLFFALLAGIVIVPGMDMLFVLANALTGGRRAGLSATAGIMAGGIVHTAVGAFGVGLVLRLAPSLFSILLFVGAGYMAWIGVSLARSSITVGAVGPATSRSPGQAFRQGLTTCLLNPKAYLFTASIFPQFIRPQYGTVVAQAMVMAAMTVLTQLAIYGSLALLASRSRAFLTASPRATAIAGRVVGGLFILGAGLTACHGW